MSLVGRMTYGFTVGDDVFFYYVVADATLFETDIIALIASLFGSAPPLLTLLKDLLTDALGGVAQGLYKAPSIAEVLEHVPEEIEEGISILRNTYLHGGSEQWYVTPHRLKLAGASGSAFSDVYILPELLTLDIIGVEALLIRYQEALDEDDYILPLPGGVDIPVKGGRYRVILPSPAAMTAGRFWDVPEIANWRHIINPGFNTYTSYCLCRVLGLLAPPDVVPPGHYFHPDAILQFNNGWSATADRCDPFLSDEGYDCSVPFTNEIPSDAVLEASGLERQYLATTVSIRQVAAVGAPASNWRYPGGVTLAPVEEVEPPPEDLSAIPHLAASALIFWALFKRRKR